MNYLLLPTLSVAIVLFVLGRRAAIAGWSTPALLLAGSVLSLPALLFAFYYTHLFDDALWFYSFRAIRYSELAASGAGSLAGVVAGIVERRSKRRGFTTVGVLLALVLLLLVPYIKPLVAPLNATLHDRWSEDVCMQSTPSTCGPSSAATVLRRFGVRVSERKLADECYSYAGGTEIWYIARAIRSRGMDAQYRLISPDSLLVPSIAGVRLGNPNGPGHFIAILDRDGERYVVGDPLVGRRVLTVSEIHAKYHITGFFLVVQPAEVHA
jgi:hypothetical protein